MQFWPKGIIIALALFIAMTLGFVHVALSERVDLVAPDYYYRDKEYSQRLEREKNFLQHGEAKLVRSAQGIAVTLPPFFAGKAIAGKVSFYSPLNPAEDFTVPLAVKGAQFFVPAPNLAAHKWRLRFDFSAAGTPYYFEAELW